MEYPKGTFLYAIVHVVRIWSLEHIARISDRLRIYQQLRQDGSPRISNRLPDYVSTLSYLCEGFSPGVGTVFEPGTQKLRYLRVKV